MTNKTFGSRLLQRRKQLGLSQSALAKLVGVAHVTISQWEREETQPTGKRLFALSQGLQCTPSWLIFGNDEQLPGEPVENIAQLSEAQRELIRLFDSLPASEQEVLLDEMRLKVEHFNKLFNEMIQARKRTQNK